MCEPDGFEPQPGWHVRKQIHQVGFWGSFSLQLSFSAKRKLENNNSS
jgi:hypothetical protein